MGELRPAWRSRAQRRIDAGRSSAAPHRQPPTPSSSGPITSRWRCPRRAQPSPGPALVDPRASRAAQHPQRRRLRPPERGVLSARRAALGRRGWTRPSADRERPGARGGAPGGIADRAHGNRTGSGRIDQPRPGPGSPQPPAPRRADRSRRGLRAPSAASPGSSAGDQRALALPWNRRRAAPTPGPAAGGSRRGGDPAHEGRPDQRGRGRQLGGARRPRQPRRNPGGRASLLAGGRRPWTALVGAGSAGPAPGTPGPRCPPGRPAFGALRRARAGEPPPVNCRAGPKVPAQNAGPAAGQKRIGVSRANRGALCRGRPCAQPSTPPKECRPGPRCPRITADLAG